MTIIVDRIKNYVTWRVNGKNQLKYKIKPSILKGRVYFIIMMIDKEDKVEI